MKWGKLSEKRKEQAASNQACASKVNEGVLLDTSVQVYIVLDGDG
ncbi:hypothetical protein [Vibrio spartinae]|uniref:Uncharacterized protein n=1 Tax=Vibrio spartinae TaxID=1918945 RepID=A0A1N6M0I3_9VIBR|nr:hypothetical protein [Vibrio spartinae]QMV15631.1 hypothetical protein Vspart_02962 [Vibrio spartinae]SIO92876.1 hypothetical protein VSP9026_00506 [Vibrio spartinae]